MNTLNPQNIINTKLEKEADGTIKRTRTYQFDVVDIVDPVQVIAVAQKTIDDTNIMVATAKPPDPLQINPQEVFIK